MLKEIILRPQREGKLYDLIVIGDNGNKATHINLNKDAGYGLMEEFVKQFEDERKK